MDLSQHPLKLLSAFVCLLLVVGVWNRRRAWVHVPLMLVAFVIDLGIVLYLEIQRGVVESIPKREMTSLLMIHLVLSVLVLALYAVQIHTGVRNVRGKRSRVHPRTAVAFLVLRFGNLITSWMIT